ncbi:hypothetical protein ACWD1Y_43005 [Streptomyces sp. NPDC002814]
MSSARDEDRVFARIEHWLTSDDPALAQRMDALNQQFGKRVGDGRLTVHGDEDPVSAHVDEERVTGKDPGGKERSGTFKLAVVLAVVAAVGLLLTAILSAPSNGERQSPQPHGVAPPASSQVIEDRSGPGEP